MDGQSREGIMNIDTDNAVTIGGIIASLGVAWGTVTAKMHNFVTYEGHRTICHEKSEETNEKLEVLFEQLRNISGTINEIRGYLKGREGEVP